ncbi:WD40 repeat-like protein [Obba rivulosa]|uniref:WD40 repeat-like protein n=1 Tax=Obba rivulosa TaxID=1052685 RepID=A0A8E2AYL6_9APHY|nr:WD40 repeat-like protein [Obba rivulosa]
MAVYPHSSLFVGPSQSLLISGPHAQVINTQDGSVLHSTANWDETQKAALLKSGPVRVAAVDEGFTHLATVGDDKRLKVWQIEGLKILSERELPKKATGAQFTKDGQTILVSDKFGDIFKYPLHYEPTPTSVSEPSGSTRGAVTSHENPSNGTLILGHVSLLTDFLLTSDEKYIVTADRDEHIRVSWYPQGYVIERYCLGHRRFVSAVHIPPFAPSTLVSGGGDPMLKLWDWFSGRLLSEIPISDAVEPFIQVKPPKRRRVEGDGDDGEGAESQNKGRRRGGRRKGKGKGKEQEGGESREMSAVQEEEGEELTPELVEDGASEAQEAGAAEPIAGAEAATQQAEAGQKAEAEPPVLVLHKIRSLDLGEHGRHLVFSAVGANAVFYCAFPEDGTTSPPIVHAVDLGKPVVDFTLTTDGLMWVLFDGTWGVADETSDEAKANMVKLLSWASGTPIEVSPSDSPALLNALRSTCVLSATPEDLKTLDIYSALSTMPKNVDPEHDPLGSDAPMDLAVDLREDAVEGKELTQREQARLRKKRALAAKIQEQHGSRTPGADRGGEGEERETKKARSEPDTEGDTVMHES